MTALHIAGLMKARDFWYANTAHNDYRRGIGKSIAGDPEWEIIHDIARDISGVTGWLAQVDMAAVCNNPEMIDLIIYKLQQRAL